VVRTLKTIRRAVPARRTRPMILRSRVTGMDNNKTETEAYIERRVRKVLAINALKRIRIIVGRIEASDRKARIAVYVFALLFTAIAILLFFIISQMSR
jgi:hypothetical protein